MIRRVNRKVTLCVALIIMILFNYIPMVSAQTTNEPIALKYLGVNKSILYKNKALIVNVCNYFSEGEQLPLYNALYPTYNYNTVSNKEKIDENSILWKVLKNRLSI